MPIVFVAGTDTGVGKTWVAVRLLKLLRQQGFSAVGFKPVAAGCEETPEGLRNDDAEQLLAASSAGFAYDEINPVALREPIAPHIAAAHEGRVIDPERIIAGAVALQGRADWVVVEGAGGLMVPLNAQTDFLDLLSATQWPALLVIGMRLGCLNHAYLSASVLKKAGIPFAWHANVLPPEQPSLMDNLQALQERMPAPQAQKFDLSLVEKLLRLMPEYGAL